MTDIITVCRDNLPGDALEFGASMSKYTTFKAGGPAQALFSPRNETELLSALNLARTHGIPVTIIGNGSNLLVKDSGITGLVIRIADSFSMISVSGDTITAEAGALLSRTAAKALESSLTGLEFASGIPGSVGGGCAMNAGAYGGQLSDVIEYLRIIDAETLTVREYPASELEMSYRSTRMLKRGDIVTKAVFRLKPGDKADIRALMDDLNARRRDKQPLAYPSAGSTFKRPEGHFAGQLIEQAGLKGFTIGGAQVSEKHAGFVINTGNATADDILNVISEVQRRVKESSGIDLETEVRILG